MILLETATKSDTFSSSPLGLSTSQDEPTISFSQLLRGAVKEDSKSMQNGAVVLSLDGNQKTDQKLNSKINTFLSLLKNNELPIDEPKEILELNPKLINTLSTKDLKT